MTNIKQLLNTLLHHYFIKKINFIPINNKLTLYSYPKDMFLDVKLNINDEIDEIMMFSIIFNNNEFLFDNKENKYNIDEFIDNYLKNITFEEYYEMEKHVLQFIL